MLPADHYTARMPHPILTKEQLRKLFDQVGDHVVYFDRMIKRMNARGFSGEDELFKLACKCKDACLFLRMAAHYASCDSGVGPRDDPGKGRTGN